MMIGRHMMNNLGAPIGPQKNAPSYTAENDILAGKCFADTNPDAWFPDIVGAGAPSRKRCLPVALEAKRAIDICNTCDVRERCLAIGMEPVNLPYGIWGGKLPHERIKASGKEFAPLGDEGKALRTMQALQPYFDEVGIGQS